MAAQRRVIVKVELLGAAGGLNQAIAVSSQAVAGLQQKLAAVNRTAIAPSIKMSALPPMPAIKTPLFTAAAGRIPPILTTGLATTTRSVVALQTQIAKVNKTPIAPVVRIPAIPAIKVPGIAVPVGVGGRSATVGSQPSGKQSGQGLSVGGLAAGVAGAAIASRLAGGPTGYFGGDWTPPSGPPVSPGGRPMARGPRENKSLLHQAMLAARPEDQTRLISEYLTPVRKKKGGDLPAVPSAAGVVTPLTPIPWGSPLPAKTLPPPKKNLFPGYTPAGLSPSMLEKYLEELRKRPKQELKDAAKEFGVPMKSVQKRSKAGITGAIKDWLMEQPVMPMMEPLAPKPKKPIKPVSPPAEPPAGPLRHWTGTTGTGLSTSLVPPPAPAEPVPPAAERTGWLAALNRKRKAYQAFQTKIIGKLTDRYGAKQTAAIIAGGQALGWGALAQGAVTGVPLWLPGSTLWGMAPFVGLAEIHKRMRMRAQARKGGGGTPGSAAGVPESTGTPSAPSPWLAESRRTIASSESQLAYLRGGPGAAATIKAMQAESALAKQHDWLRRVSERGRIGAGLETASEKFAPVGRAARAGATIGGGIIAAGVAATPALAEQMTNSFKFLAGEIGISVIPQMVALSGWIQKLGTSWRGLNESTNGAAGSMLVWGTAALGTVAALDKVGQVSVGAWSAVRSLGAFGGTAIGGTAQALGIGAAAAVPAVAAAAAPAVAGAVVPAVGAGVGVAGATAAGAGVGAGIAAIAVPLGIAAVALATIAGGTMLFNKWYLDSTRQPGQAAAPPTTAMPTTAMRMFSAQAEIGSSAEALYDRITMQTSNEPPALVEQNARAMRELIAALNKTTAAIEQAGPLPEAP